MGFISESETQAVVNKIAQTTIELAITYPVLRSPIFFT